MTGMEPTEQHLKGSNHKEAAARYAIGHRDTAPHLLLSLSSLTRMAVTSGVIQPTHLGNIKCTGGATALHPTGSDDLEVKKAIDEGHVRPTDHVMSPYACIPCHKHFNSKQSLYQHLKSNNHKKVTSNTTHKDPGRPIMNRTSHDTYSVLSSPRGIVHVFNYKFAGQGFKWERKGAEHDSTNLNRIFTTMGYEVKVHESLSNNDTRKMMNSIQNDKRLKDVDALIFFFLSRGNDSYTFYTNDQIAMKLFDIRYMFTDSKCPAMSSKPKIFFMNYCRGEEMELMEVDSTRDIPNDMVTVHAAAEGIMADTTSASGTHFVEHLCQTLMSYSRSHELREIYTMLREEMRARNSTKPMWEDYGFQKFYFNPV
ncbi:hypothetical protein Pcinc_001015 [Petrolisthes cinctipes]|uniref:C2H2-type domain-containing protein n=1 Tax=Petrolisthes cinctipes TaxID=88211 RepID=A0AAE1GNP6_PETCI|nr:hypothetical protein Pcinc_001015 [Petrolisthes cinctipes]